MTLDPAIESSLRARFNPPGSALRQAQLKMLDILVEVDRICRRNNISYRVVVGHPDRRSKTWRIHTMGR